MRIETNHVEPQDTIVSDRGSTPLTSTIPGILRPETTVFADNGPESEKPVHKGITDITDESDTRLCTGITNTAKKSKQTAEQTNGRQKVKVVKLQVALSG